MSLKSFIILQSPKCMTKASVVKQAKASFEAELGSISRGGKSPFSIVYTAFLYLFFFLSFLYR